MSWIPHLEGAASAPESAHQQLVLSAPLAIGLLVTYALWRGGIRPVIVPSAWVGLLYQIAVSQFLGFAFYYRGLALGGVAKMSQVQQFQSVLAVLAAAVILGEKIDAQLWVVLGLLLVAVGAARWSLQSRDVNVEVPGVVRGER
jgi:drug/metabolite transporter (DMT)-like permease